MHEPHQTTIHARVSALLQTLKALAGGCLLWPHYARSGNNGDYVVYWTTFADRRCLPSGSGRAHPCLHRFHSILCNHQLATPLNVILPSWRSHEIDLVSQGLVWIRANSWPGHAGFTDSPIARAQDVFLRAMPHMMAGTWFMVVVD